MPMPSVAGGEVVRDILSNGGDNVERDEGGVGDVQRNGQDDDDEQPKIVTQH